MSREVSERRQESRRHAPRREMDRRVVLVWEFPVRAIHWANFLAVVGLVVTGSYIHWPFLAHPSGDAPFVMAWMRLVHLVCGWALMVALAARWGWSYVGNRYASTREFYPFFYEKRRRDLFQVLKYYLFMDKRLPPHLGHNALAAFVYLCVFGLLWFQVITGFALFSQYDPGGMLYRILGRVFIFISNSWVRLAHYCVLWIFVAFFINHIYSMWISDIVERDGTAGSIFSGYKYGSVEDFEDAGHRPWKSRHERRRAGARGAKTA